MHSCEIISLQKDDSGDFANGKPRAATSLDVVRFVPVNPVKYFTLISSVHFSHFPICLTIRDPFLLMIMLQKMHSTLCVLNVSSVGTDLKRL